MINRDNYQLVKSYLDYLRQVMQLDENSIGRYHSYLRHLLLWMDEAPCTQVVTIRPTLPDYLASVGQENDEGMMAPSTLKKIVQMSKRFFTWTKMNEPHRFKNITTAWIETLHPPRAAQIEKAHVFVTLDEALQLARLPIPEEDLALRRDQAAAALLFVSGMRVGALGSLPLEAVDIPNRTIQQWPSLGVRTKNGKSATTYLLEIPELLAVIENWDQFVRAQLPATAMWHTPITGGWSQQCVLDQPPGANRHVAVARRLRLLFAAADVPFKSPHKFRHGHAVYALQRAQTMADYKAISLNLMHEDIRVTDGIYAPLLNDEVRQRVAGLGTQPATLLPADGDLARFLRGLSKSQIAQALHILADELAR